MVSLCLRRLAFASEPSLATDSAFSVAYWNFQTSLGLSFLRMRCNQVRVPSYCGDSVSLRIPRSNTTLTSLCHPSSSDCTRFNTFTVLVSPSPAWLVLALPRHYPSLQRLTVTGTPEDRGQALDTAWSGLTLTREVHAFQLFVQPVNAWSHRQESFVGQVGAALI